MKALSPNINGQHTSGSSKCYTPMYNSAAGEQCVQIMLVTANAPISVPTAFHSFGGWKRSLLASLHMHGPGGVSVSTRMKMITQRLPSCIGEEANHFSMPTYLMLGEG